MFNNDAENSEMLDQDREDLITLLSMRFGRLAPDVIEAIESIDQLDMLQSLILAAANAPNWETFGRQLLSNKKAFRLVGETYNPLADIHKGDRSNGL
ncbi:hypothetical protein GCM10011391_31430 [Pullulanibacillus camelliae]|uniref:Uncharacterized protein n=1 Tax=Pullulanibacillus camelliae TaxID=1707096 RepID=A0A8J2YLA1_9BACL|nr:hypothetical protein [Pullulanibacillus camelliae]GGE50401.1 hypothetical protein GCM10011391_31430 [Pullulanibacillus camelliae]